MPVFAGEELGKLRTINVPALPKQTASAEFFRLTSQQGIEGVQFISGSDSLRNAAHAIQTAKYTAAFPDSGPEDHPARHSFLLQLHHAELPTDTAPSLDGSEGQRI